MPTVLKQTLIGLILLVGIGAASAEQVAMTPDQARELAHQQLGVDPSVSVQLAQTLLQHFPDDFDTLMILATAQMALGDFQTAAAKAKKAYRVAPKGPARMNAARLAATAHFKADQHSRAELWLRKALHNAPDAGSQQVLQSEFQTVRQANPLTVNLSFSLAPNSNINNGSNSEFIYLWNLPFLLNPDARALAGYEASANIDLTYRLSQSQTHSSSIGLSLFARTFELTKAAAAAAPTVSGSDYSFGLVELSFNHMRAFKNLPGPSSFGVRIGKNWYGGDEFTNYGQLQFGQEIRLSDRSALNASLTGKHEISIRDGGITSDTVNFSTGYTHVLANGDRIGLSIGHEVVHSPDVNRDSTAMMGQLSYQIARPVAGMALSGNLSFENRDFAVSPYTVDGRNDQVIRLALSAVFVDVSYFGFSPSLTIEASQTESNVSLFERQSAGIRMGIQSTF